MRKWNLFLGLAVLGSLGFGLAWWGQREPGPSSGGREDPPRLSWKTEGGLRWLELEPAGAGPGFTKLAAEVTGLRSRNLLSVEKITGSPSGLIYTQGSGVALGDVDGDGWIDIYLCRLEGPNALYRNLGDWRFQEVTAHSGSTLACRGSFSSGACFADLEGDGDLDLLVTAYKGRNRCFLNDGEGLFREAPHPFEQPQRGSTTLALADVDADGDLDLYLTNYRAETDRSSTPDYSGVTRGPDGRLQVPPELHDKITIINGKIRELGEPDALFLNDGQGGFSEASFAERFSDRQARPRPAPLDWGLTSRFADVDADGDPDLYVCNDFWSPDRLWLNQGDGRFRLASTLVLRQLPYFSMGVDVADVNRDGAMDLLVTDMLARDHARSKRQMGQMQVTPLRVGKVRNQPQVMRNTLYAGRGDGTFAEVAQMAGVAASEWSWNPLFLDVDLDGYEDVIVPTGYPLDVNDADRNAELETMVASGRLKPQEWKTALILFDRLALPNVAFHNRGELRFEECAGSWGLAEGDTIEQGAALADLDNDGDLDLVTNALGDAPGVYRNEAAGGRIAVRLKGRAPNTRAIGAKLELLGGPVPQSQEVICGGAYLSGSDPTRTFATGEAGELTLRVTWPDGSWSRLEGLRPNRLYEIDQADTPVMPIEEQLPPPEPHFEDVSQLLGEHAHPEEGYNDFARQLLLPNRLSQLGPGVTWQDLDGDGHEDLLVAAGKSGRLGVLLNDGAGGFRSLPPEANPALAERDQTTVLAVPGAEGLELLVGSSIFEESITSPAPGALRYRVARAQGPGESLRLEALDSGSLAEDLAQHRVRVGIDDPTGGLAKAGFRAGDRILAVDGTPIARERLQELFAGSGAKTVQVARDAERLELTLDLSRPPGGRLDYEPAEHSATGPLTLGDVDGDGDLDLFVGGRTLPGEYPRAASSRLFRREGAGFRLDRAASAAFRDLGLVSGATFSDVDGDGDPDLLLACEWGPLRLFENEAGQLRERTRERGLAELSGWWTGVTTGDLDGDGTLELIATNWGLNHKYHADPEHPARIHFADFDGSGSLDIVEAKEKGGRELPVRGLSCSSRCMPFVRERTPTYRDFGLASLADIYGPGLQQADAVAAGHLAHTLFVRRGERYEARPLPRETQRTVAFGASVADLDGDGHEDLLLAQNFFAVQVETSRLDGGRALWLRGDGRGGLAPVPGQRSGLAVYGEQRGAALCDYDGDGRLDWAVSQNGTRTRLYRNRGARPGLRVRLRGPAANPDAVGAQVRAVFGEERGPVREQKAGSGYWSQDGRVLVLGTPQAPDAVWVRWPGGAETTTPVPAGAREVVLEPPPG